jgi:nitrogen fixation NifU-like protein
MEDLYRERILDHYQNPRNYGMLEAPDISYEDDNPMCGDVIRIEIKLDEQNRVSQVGFSGEGCAISTASASMLTEEILGKTLDQVKQIGKDDILQMLGVQLGPVRLKCALLSLKVLRGGIYGVASETLAGEDE